MRKIRSPKTWELEGSERFEPVRRLGGGAFGEVYEVVDRTRGARVALKLLTALEPEEIYRFKQEFRALAGLAHRNLVQLYELLTDGDRWLFTMELVEGIDALGCVRAGRDAEDAPTELDVGAAPRPRHRGARFDEGRLRNVLAQLAEGLSALHEAGKMHRDVKPSNVLVTREGRVVLVDFGLAVRLSASGEVSRSSLVGTPAYLAPELVLGEPASAASDWYAVGVLLFEALTGELPFRGTLEKILSDKLARDAPAPSTIEPDIPRDLERLCVALLARRPESRPRGDDILERVGGSAAPRSGAREIPFVGRTAERAAIAEAWRRVRGDRKAAIVLVAGTSGIGKSALVARASADIRAETPGAVLLAGRCWEQESVPYKAIDGLVDPLSKHLRTLPTRVVAALLPHDVRTLARIFPVLEQVPAIAEAPSPPVILRDGVDLRRSAFRALRELLQRLASERPLVLVMDDLQWGDQDSGALLNDLLAPPDPPRLLLIASYRSDEAETSACLRAALPALRAMGGPEIEVETVELDVLAEDDARALACALVPDGTTAREAALNIAREAGGRPFFIRELSQVWKDHGRSNPEEEPSRAPSIDDLVRARAAALPAGARALLEVIAVAGRPIDRAAAARAAGLEGGEPIAYSALRAAHLVRRRDAEDRDEIEPYHDRIREAVAASLSPEQRTDALRRLARALDGAGAGDPEALATYFLGGGDPTRARALFAAAAGEAAASFAFTHAASLYRRALSLHEPGDVATAPLFEALGEALVNAGRGAEAASAFTAAADLSPPERSFELRRRAMEQLLFAGHTDEGTIGLRRCLAELGVPFPDRVWQILLSVVAGVLWLSLRGFGFRARRASEAPVLALRRIDTCLGAARAFGNIDTLLGAYFCVIAARISLAAGEPLRVFESLAMFGAYAIAASGRRPGVVRRADEAARALAHQFDDPHAAAMLDVVAGASAAMAGALATARTSLQTSRAVFETGRVGSGWELNMLHEFSSMSLFWAGAWGELARALAASLADARARGNKHLDRNLSLRFGHVPALLADDPDEARRVHAEARAGWWPSKFSSLDHFSLLSRVDIQIYEDGGSGARAMEIVEGAWGELERAQILRVEKMAMYPLNLRARAAIAFAATGAPDRERRSALAFAERAAARLATIRNRLAPGLGALAEAGVAAARGEPSAVALYARAEEALASVGCTHYAAAAKRRRGLLLGGDEGRALVDEADARLRAEGAKNPARLAAMLAPGAK